ncbi:MAG: alanine racemase [Thermodesulfobacteriota bacterium]
MACHSFNQVTIEAGALCHNYRLLQQRADNGGRVLAMIKADAYGHGMNEVAAILADAGCRDFGVAELVEGVRLRKSGVVGNIFIFLGFARHDAALFFDYDLIPVIYDLESGSALSREAVKRKKEIVVHLKVDCGMGRLGVAPNEVRASVASLKEMEGIIFGGLASHFPRADEPEGSQTREQLASFANLVTELPQEDDLVCHTANSGGILYFPDSHCDMVRAGISLYGYYPDGFAGIGRERGEKLEPAMTFASQVLQVKTVPSGTGISYGHTFTTERETRLAVLPVGYEDGLSRALSNRGEVLIRGRRARIRGRICMNLCMVDVSHMEDVQVGDRVVLLGSQGDEVITADEIADWMGSISYEVLCLFGNNNERSYRE